MSKLNLIAIVAIIAAFAVSAIVATTDVFAQDNRTSSGILQANKIKTKNQNSINKKNKFLFLYLFDSFLNYIYRFYKY